jgi:hypothetical protein
MQIIPPPEQRRKQLAQISSYIDQSKRYAIAIGISSLLTLNLTKTGLAQSNLIPLAPPTCDLNLSLLKSADLSKDRNIVTADTASSAGSTTPSLWWTNEQFSTKLVTNWIANQKQRQIYLLVNAQSWNSLDYVDRYQTIDRFGRAAQDYGYNLKICNSQKVALADYTCESIGGLNPLVLEGSTETRPTNQNNQNNCQILLHTNGQTGLGIKAK